MRISTIARVGLACAGVLLVGCGVSDKKIKIAGLGEARQLHTQRASIPKIAMFVDARPPSQYVTGHIEGAVNWRLDQFKPTADTDPKIEEYRNILVYGDDPASPAARGLTKRLMEIGYEGVKMFGPGFKAWAGSKLPVETGEPAKK
jgi:rhodanese-related sulfurtransferase